MHRILLGVFLRIGILMFFRIAMFWNRTFRVNGMMDNPADFEIRFVIRKELLPMFKTLREAKGVDRQMNLVRRIRQYDLAFNSLSVRPRIS